MPRRARIDAPGALHDVFCRGIERRKIFWEDSDRNNFLKGDCRCQRDRRCQGLNCELAG